MVKTFLTVVLILFFLYDFSNSQNIIHHDGQHRRQYPPIYNQHGAFVVILKNGQGPSLGSLRISQKINGLEIRGLLHDLPSGAYGFHVHENGNLSDNCKAAGSHYNPLNKNHGGPYDVERHFGDLGNILFDVSGISRIRITDPILSLYGPQSIFGRSIVIHEKIDDLGRGGNPESLKTGNSGKRIACGIILPEQSYSRLTHEKLQY